MAVLLAGAITLSPGDRTGGVGPVHSTPADAGKGAVIVVRGAAIAVAEGNRSDHLVFTSVGSGAGRDGEASL